MLPAAHRAASDICAAPLAGRLRYFEVRGAREGDTSTPAATGHVVKMRASEEPGWLVVELTLRAGTVADVEKATGAATALTDRLRFARRACFGHQLDFELVVAGERVERIAVSLPTAPSPPPRASREPSRHASSPAPSRTSAPARAHDDAAKAAPALVSWWVQAATMGAFRMTALRSFRDGARVHVRAERRVRGADLGVRWVPAEWIFDAATGSVVTGEQVPWVPQPAEIARARRFLSCSVGIARSRGIPTPAPSST